MKTLGQVAHATLVKALGTDATWDEMGLHFQQGWESAAGAVVSAHEARRWRPIAEAPKDGTWILTWVGGVVKPFPYICAWSDSYSIHGLGGNWNDGLCQMGIEVTHWSHLPDPPKEAE